MSNFYIHLSWFFIIVMLAIFSLILAFLVTFNSCIYLSFSFLSIWNFPLRVRIFFDTFSCWFLRVVLLISSVIIVYSFFYMSPYSKANYFLVLTLFFIISMALVICFSSLFFIMLGWDGLGLVSFFLIVYYQNSSSIFSGTFTLLINRVGDAFFLCSITLYSYTYFDLAFLTPFSSTFILILLLVLTFITKSAIFPFSPWLPIAIAAPTPISALVHSSTLVTSGLFLMIKYSYILYSSWYLIALLLVLRVFTSFYAGINTLFEKDLKKLIALSTLRHLGFIRMSFSLGLLNLSFFHLLTHALFKSVLFMSMGDIIVNLSHSQDIRYLSMGSYYTPFSCYIMNISILNLLGFPRISGFWSKDLILESLNYSSCRVVLYFIRIINVLFTFYYSFQLFYYSFQLSKVSPYFLFHSSTLIHSILLALLGLSSLFFSSLFLSFFAKVLFYPVIPLFLKLLPLLILSLVFIHLLLSKTLFSSQNQVLTLYFSSIIFLYFLITKTSTSFYYSFSLWFSKTVELGFLNSSLNIKLPEFFIYSGTLLLKHSYLNPMSTSLAFSSILFFFLLF